MLFQYWPTAYGAGATLKQHWVKFSCLLGHVSECTDVRPQIAPMLILAKVTL